MRLFPKENRYFWIVFCFWFIFFIIQPLVASFFLRGFDKKLYQKRISLAPNLATCICFVVVNYPTIVVLKSEEFRRHKAFIVMLTMVILETLQLVLQTLIDILIFFNLGLYIISLWIGLAVNAVFTGLRHGTVALSCLLAYNRLTTIIFYRISGNGFQTAYLAVILTLIFRTAVEFVGDTVLGYKLVPSTEDFKLIVETLALVVRYSVYAYLGCTATVYLLLLVYMLYQGLRNQVPSALKTEYYLTIQAVLISVLLVCLSVTDPNQNGNVINLNGLWSNGEVDYVIGPGFTVIETTKLLQAMTEIQLNTCIRFLPKRADHGDYVFFNRQTTDCRSSVGRQGGEQIVDLGEDCFTGNTILHELLHTLGYYHEQCRSDRDSYVNINLANIALDDQPNFRIDTRALTDTPYSVDSIMQYPAGTDAINSSLDTITSKKPGQILGGGDHLSNIDVQRINKDYKCRQNATTTAPVGFNWQRGGYGGMSWAQGCNFPGYDYKQLWSTYDDCANQCIYQYTQGCDHFTWTPESNGKCWLKKGVPDGYQPVQADSSHYCGYRVINWDQTFSVIWSNGCEFPGGDNYRTVMVPSEQCGDVCAKDLSCTHYSWTLDYKCALKRGIPAGAQPKLVDWRRTCGYKTDKLLWKQDNNNGLWYATGCNFALQTVIDRVPTRRDDCSSRCAANMNCTHFTWDSQVELCYLKSATGTFPRPQCAQPFFLCGFKNFEYEGGEVACT